MIAHPLTHTPPQGGSLRRVRTPQTDRYLPRGKSESNSELETARA
jgi:hypothetical protein